MLTLAPYPRPRPSASLYFPPASATYRNPYALRGIRNPTSAAAPVSVLDMNTLPNHVLTSIIEDVAIGIDVITGRRQELCRHRLAVARLFILATTCRRMRDLIVPVLVRTVVIASRREWIGWAGWNYAGVSGLLRQGPLCWDITLGSLPVRHIWLSTYGHDWPSIIYPDPDWDTTHHLLQPEPWMEMHGFQDISFRPLSLSGGFSLHLVPLVCQPPTVPGTDDPPYPPPTCGLRPQRHHLLPTVAPADTALLCDSDLQEAWFWIGSYNCMLSAFDPEGLNPLGRTQTESDTALAAHRVSLTEDMLLFPGRSRNRHLVRTSLPLNREGARKIAALRDMFASVSGAGDGWILSAGSVEAEELEEDVQEGQVWWEYPWRDQDFPPYSEFLPRTVPKLLDRAVRAVLCLRLRMFKSIILSSPNLRLITTPLNAGVGDHAFLDYIRHDARDIDVALRYMIPPP